MRAVASPAAPCPSCGRVSSEGDLTCEMCGTLLSRASPRPAASFAPATGHVPAAEMAAWGDPARAKSILGLPESWFFLLVGLALAPVLTFAPLLQYVGWFLTSLFHETGHAALSWLFGCPAFPAIRLDGHAAAVHGEQNRLLCALVLFGLVALTWMCRRRPVLRVVLGASVVAYPFLALSGAREIVFLAGGHLGELAFATVFLSRCLSGGFTESHAERAAHGLLGWYLLLRHAWLVGGLFLSEPARQAYARSGSFGLTNDYIRLAGEFETRLATVGGWMLWPTLAVIPVAILVSRRS
jgi:hypothetical protein